tara:strand:- start:6921 stop:7166 length:246 start_codon:yes stop_codon:yes gene_type:complete
MVNRPAVSYIAAGTRSSQATSPVATKLLHLIAVLRLDAARYGIVHRTTSQRLLQRTRKSSDLPVDVALELTPHLLQVSLQE